MIRNVSVPPRSDLSISPNRRIKTEFESEGDEVEEEMEKQEGTDSDSSAVTADSNPENSSTYANDGSECSENDRALTLYRPVRRVQIQIQSRSDSSSDGSSDSSSDSSDSSSDDSEDERPRKKRRTLVSVYYGHPPQRRTGRASLHRGLIMGATTYRGW